MSHQSCQDQQDIFTAVQSGDIDLVQKRIMQSTPVDTTDAEGWSLLHHAAAFGQVGIITLLHQNHCSPEHTDSNGRSALHYAAANGFTDSIGILVHMGCNIHAADNDGNTPLKWAEICGHSGAVQELQKLLSSTSGELQKLEEGLESSNNVMQMTISGDTTTQISEEERIDNILSNDVPPHTCNGSYKPATVTKLDTSLQTVPPSEYKLNGRTTLDDVQFKGTAMVQQDPPTMDLTNRNGVKNQQMPHQNLQLQDSYERNQQICAYKTQSKDRLELFREIVKAMQTSNIEMVVAYLNQYSDAMNCADTENCSLLHCAASCGQTEVMKLLRDRRCQVNVCDKKGRTPLHYAAADGQVPAIKMLVDMGCNVNCGDHKGITPLKWAEMCEQHAAVKELTMHGGTGTPTAATVEGAGSLGAFRLQDKRIEYHKEQGGRNVQNGRGIASGDFKRQEVNHQRKVIENEQIQDPRRPTLTNHHCHRLDQDAIVSQPPVHQKRGGGTFKVINKETDSQENYDIENKAEGDIFEAARAGDTATVQKYLDIGIPVDVRNEDGCTPLHCAAGEGQIKMVKLLVEKGCPKDGRDSSGSTPLDYAIAYGHTQIQQFLKLPHSKDDAQNDHKTDTDEREAVMDLFKDAVKATLMHNVARVKSYLDVCLPAHTKDQDDRSLLHYAAAFGCIEVVKILHERGVHIDTPDSRGCTPLHYAATHGNVEAIRALIEMGCTVNLMDNIGNTPLKAAELCKQYEAVYELTKKYKVTSELDKEEFLLSCDKDSSEKACNMASPSLLDEDAKDPLVTEQFNMPASGNVFYAAGSGDTSAIKRHLELGGPVNLSDPRGRTLLHFAAAKGQMEVAKLLVKNGCKIDSMDIRGFTPLTYANTYRHFHIRKYLENVKKTVPDHEGDSKLPHNSPGRVKPQPGFSIQAMNHFLDAGSSADYRDQHGRTVLHAAAARGSVEVIMFLHNKGVPINSRTKKFRTPLHFAAIEGNVSAIQILIKMGGEVNAIDYKGLTPMHCAQICGEFRALNELKAHGGKCQKITDSETKVGLRRDIGCPPQVESELTIVDALKQLHNSGGKLNTTVNNGKTLLHIASIRGMPKLIKFLHERGLDVNAKDNDDWAPLHFAAASGHIEAIKILIELGADVNSISDCGTPAQCATMCKQYQAAIELAKFGGVWESPTDNCGEKSDQRHGKNQPKQVHHTRRTNLPDSGTPFPNFDANNSGANLPDSHANYLIPNFGANLQEFVPKLPEFGPNLPDFAPKLPEFATNLLLQQDLSSNISNSQDLASLLGLSTKFPQPDTAKQNIFHPSMSNIGNLADLFAQLSGVGASLPHIGTNAPNPSLFGLGLSGIFNSLLRKFTNCLKENDLTVLHAAALGGQIDMMKSLVNQQGVDVNIQNSYGCTPMHLAAAQGQLQSVYTLLELGGRKSLTLIGKEGVGTPLHQAAAGGHTDTVIFLLNEGCPVACLNSYGRTALHMAASAGQAHLMQLLTDHGLDVNLATYEGMTPLHFAAAHNRLQTIHTLLSLGASKSMTIENELVVSPLYQAVVKGHKDVVKALLNAGHPIESCVDRKRTILHVAALNNQVDVIETLLDHGLDVNMLDNLESITCLHIAARRGQTYMAKALLRLGAQKSMTIVAPKGGTPLHQAIGAGHMDVVELLLNAGCPIDVVCKERNQSVLHAAAQCGQVKFMEMFKERGLDVNRVDTYKENALHTAAMHGHPTAVHALIKLGVKDQPDECNMKMWDYVLLGLYPEHQALLFALMHFCQACGITWKKPESDAGMNFLDVFSILSSNGFIDINRILCLAAFRGDTDMFEALINSNYPLDQQRMPNILKILSRKYKRIMPVVDDLVAEMHLLDSSEALNPLHISLLMCKWWNYNHKGGFTEKLICHPRTKYTIHEHFPNGLSPLDVARQFQLHDIAVMIERAGGRPGMWADLPKEIRQKCLTNLMSLKKLRGTSANEDPTPMILMMMGVRVIKMSEAGAGRSIIFSQKPELSTLQKCVLAEVKVKKKWNYVGSVLDINVTILNKLAKDSDDNDEAYYFMLRYWLEHGRSVTWKTLLDAIGFFETKKTMDDIRKNIEMDLSLVIVSNACMHELSVLPISIIQ